MPEESSDQERYSIDEMMERLKTKPSPEPEEEGEWVTRDDGSKALRIRKKKRRSKQPHKEKEARMRKVKIAQVALLVVLSMIVLIGSAGLLLFLNSATYRDSIKNSIQAHTGSSAAVAQFRVNPKAAAASAISMRWPEGNVMEELTAITVTARISPGTLFLSDMKGDDIDAQQMILRLRFPQSGKPLTQQLNSSSPRDILFRKIRTKNCSLHLGDPSDRAFSISESEASIQLAGQGERMKLSINRGALLAKGWPSWKIDRGYFEFRDEKVDIVTLRLTDGKQNRGSLNLSGTFEPQNPARISKLHTTLDAFPMASLVGEELGAMLEGNLNTVESEFSNYFSFALDPKIAPKLMIDFRSSLHTGLRVREFPFLLQISNLLEDSWFATPIFTGESATGTLIRESGTISLENLYFEQKGRMALRGNISMDANKNLSGNLQIGLSEAVIAAMTQVSRLDEIFGEEDLSFRWITVKISGTALFPADNFKDLYSATSEQRTEDATPPLDAEEMFDDLTRPRSK